MKITDIEAIPVDVPRLADVQVVSAYPTIPSARYVLVKVRTDHGPVGLGEASCEGDWTGEDIHSCTNAIRNLLAPALIGEDPLRIQAASDRMKCAVVANIYAKAAIEMALWDITGKLANLPLADIWGGRVRDAVAVKFVVSGPPARAAEMARDALAKGFAYIKIKTGTGVTEDIARVRAVRDEVGEDVPIGVDSNMGWSFAEAVRAIGPLEALGVSFIEQPFDRHPRSSLADYRRRTHIPIVAHESLFTIEDARDLLSSRAADVWGVTPATHGGYLATRTILELANAGGLPCLLGSTQELGINTAFMTQIGVSAPAIDGTVPSDIHGPFYHVDDLVEHSFTISNSAIAPPPGPGLGVTLNEAAVKRYRVDIPC